MEILKVYKYKGAKIHVIRVGGIMQYFVVFKNDLYANYFNLEKKLKTEEEVGAAILLVSSTAEGVVDSLVEKSKLWYSLIKRLGFVPEQKVEIKEEQKSRIENA